MWKDRSVAVVIPTYRESATIRDVIQGFDGLGIVDEILVVNNNAEAPAKRWRPLVRGRCMSPRRVMEPPSDVGSPSRAPI
jgi:hypothetical protein